VEECWGSRGGRGGWGVLDESSFSGAVLPAPWLTTPGRHCGEAIGFPPGATRLTSEGGGGALLIVIRCFTFQEVCVAGEQPEGCTGQDGCFAETGTKGPIGKQLRSIRTLRVWGRGAMKGGVLWVSAVLCLQCADMAWIKLLLFVTQLPVSAGTSRVCRCRHPVTNIQPASTGGSHQHHRMHTLHSNQSLFETSHLVLGVGGEQAGVPQLMAILQLQTPTGVVWFAPPLPEGGASSKAKQGLVRQGRFL